MSVSFNVCLAFVSFHSRTCHDNETWAHNGTLKEPICMVIPSSHTHTHFPRPFGQPVSPLMCKICWVELIVAIRQKRFFNSLRRDCITAIQPLSVRASAQWNQPHARFQCSVFKLHCFGFSFSHFLKWFWFLHLFYNSSINHLLTLLCFIIKWPFPE